MLNLLLHTCVTLSLMCDANRRIQSLRQSFANYYTPWFKDFYRDYPY